MGQPTDVLRPGARRIDNRVDGKLPDPGIDSPVPASVRQTEDRCIAAKITTKIAKLAQVPLMQCGDINVFAAHIQHRCNA